ncbi:MAG: ABC transporter ATP-binding protein [Atopostipes suicloacalis]|nr:ABC transporter ATP-binding protein [Atopostipes suicloacalis]MDN6731374.1 ABC transporter ATP-binding protein [Atopostipes suicloacalis]
MNLIEVKEVSKSFMDGRKEIQALKKTSFSVEEGEFVALIGPSGSGKSTLLTIIGGLQQPDEGKVLIQDKKFSEVDDKERTQLRFNELGFVLQASNLIPFLTVEDQLRLVDKVNKEETSSDYVKNLLEQLGIEDLANKYPGDLSGGEKQRVAIARALYHDPSVILADEPTASLDSERAYEVVGLLADSTKRNKKATIMVTHDERLVGYCDKVYRMIDGVLELDEEMTNQSREEAKESK